MTLTQVLENMAQSPLMDSGLETQAAALIRAGLELRDGKPSFWDDLVNLLTNPSLAEGCSQLLHIPRDRLHAVAHRIRRLANQTDIGGKEKILPTGE